MTPSSTALPDKVAASPAAVMTGTKGVMTRIKGLYLG